MNDDELRARLRATFHETAARTPIGADRAGEILVADGVARRRPLVAAMSAAAAVAVVAVGAFAIANDGSGGQHGVSPASGGGLGDVASASSSTSAPATCAIENYYVTASKAQLAGMTYLLASPPARYHLYGAWGTIDKGMCPDTATWYVEYDNGAEGSSTSIQLTVRKASARARSGDGVRQGLSTSVASLAASLSPTPTGVASLPENGRTSAEAAGAASSTAGTAPASTTPPGVAVTVNGHPGTFVGGEPGGKPDENAGTIVWTADGDSLRLYGPTTDGRPDALVALADSLVAVSPDDARISPPPGCDVPAGQVCHD